MGMRTVHDPYGSPAVLVDHMLGNAYEVVRYVAHEIEHLKAISHNMVPLVTLSCNLDYLKEVAGDPPDVLLLMQHIAALEARIAALEPEAPVEGG